MSTMFGHYMENFEDVEMVDPLQELQRDLEDMDLPSNLNYENSGLMSSEFFDSVLSMEQCNFRNEFDKEPVHAADSDFGFSDPDDTHFNGNTSPDSVNSSIDFEIKGFDVEDKEPNELAVQEIKSIASTVQIPTKVYISNSNGKKVIVKPFTNKNNKKNIINPKQILRVQSISGGGRSVLLPFNVTKMKNIKIINGKELQAENLKITKITDIISKKTNTVTVNKSYTDDYEISSPETFDDDSDSIDTKLDHEQQYPLLVLSDDEKRLLNKEGITLPSHYPLTKQQERELKRIRRKIRNKISAQDSRKRKKEYVDGLEERLKQGAEEKKILMNRVKHLQQQNNRLIAQMNKIQALVFNTSGSKATPTTCLLIVLVSILLVSLPNLRVHQNSELMDQQQSASRRALLSSQQATNEDLNLDEFLLFNKEEESEFPSVFDEDNNTGDVSVSKYIHNYNLENIGINSAKMIQAEDFEKDVKGTFETIRKYLQESDSLRFDYDSYGKQNPKHHSEKKFIEPDIDEFPYMNEVPPAKRIKTYDQNEIVSNNYIPISNSASNVVSATVSVNSSKKE